MYKILVNRALSLLFRPSSISRALVGLLFCNPTSAWIPWRLKSISIDTQHFQVQLGESICLIGVTSITSVNYSRRDVMFTYLVLHHTEDTFEVFISKEVDHNDTMNVSNRRS